MVEWLSHEGFHLIEAETDADAVEFYRRCGFTTEGLVDRRFPGTPRFRCTLKTDS